MQGETQFDPAFGVRYPAAMTNWVHMILKSIRHRARNFLQSFRSGWSFLSPKFCIPISQYLKRSRYTEKFLQYRLVIVDESLDGFLGHHYDYDMNLANAAKNIGTESIILSNLFIESKLLNNPILSPSFKLDMWASGSQVSPGSAEDIIYSNRRFYFDLIRSFNRLRLAPRTVIFGHMVIDKQIMGWVWFLENIKRDLDITVWILFRYEARYYASEYAQSALRRLEKLSLVHRVRLASDSRKLASAYSQLTSLPIEIMPIPHTRLSGGVWSREEIDSKISGAVPVRFACFGNPRKDKGFLDFVTAIRLLNKTPEKLRCEFILQANDPGPGISEVLNTFISSEPDNVEFIQTSMDSDTYFNVLFRSDVVVLPYWTSVYEMRTSGVFVEAVCAGKIVICSEGTWMADEIEHINSAVLCREKDPVSVYTAMLEVLKSFGDYYQNAQRNAGPYQSFHNAENLVKLLLCD